jgi:hypothetical protein
MSYHAGSRGELEGEEERGKKEGGRKGKKIEESEERRTACGLA